RRSVCSRGRRGPRAGPVPPRGSGRPRRARRRNPVASPGGCPRLATAPWSNPPAAAYPSSLPLLTSLRRFLEAPVDLVPPRPQPVPGAVGLRPLDGAGRTGGCTRRAAATEVALARLAGVRQGEDGSERAGDGTQVAADAHAVQHHLGPGGRVN